MVKKKKEAKMKKDKIISVRLNNSNLQLFNQLNITPTQLFNFALMKYSEEHISTEKALILASIQTTMVELHNCNIELEAKKHKLDILKKELANITSNEYATQKSIFIPLLDERYSEEIRNPNSPVDCVESFFEHCKDFIGIQKAYKGISDENLKKILEEFYSMKAKEVEFDELMGNAKAVNNFDFIL